MGGGKGCRGRCGPRWRMYLHDDHTVQSSKRIGDEVSSMFATLLGAATKSPGEHDIADDAAKLGSREGGIDRWRAKLVNRFKPSSAPAFAFTKSHPHRPGNRQPRKVPEFTKIDSFEDFLAREGLPGSNRVALSTSSTGRRGPRGHRASPLPPATVELDDGWEMVDFGYSADDDV